MQRAEDLRRVTAPLRAIGQALFDGRSRMRRRDKRDEPPEDLSGETRDPAAAI
jgi:hypothetical protein